MNQINNGIVEQSSRAMKIIIRCLRCVTYDNFNLNLYSSEWELLWKHSHNTATRSQVNNNTELLNGGTADDGSRV